MIPLARTLPVALVAASLLVAAHGAQAASIDAAVARVNVVGQLPLSEACASVDTRALADQLAPTWDAVAKPSMVEVNFKLRRHRVYDVQPVTDSPRAWHQIRHAVNGLDCDSGDDQAHAVRFVVRFVDDGSRLATVSLADAARR